MPHHAPPPNPPPICAALPSPEGRASGQFRLGHRPWLDGLRGVAILCVLAFHLKVLKGGSFGVDIFFVLSGFLITTLLLEEWRSRGAFSLPRFYARRFLRLVPALAVVLLAGLAYTAIFLPDEAGAFRREATVAACYVSNWPSLHGTPLPTLGHTWSLAVEEQFYLLWPLALYALLRLGLAPRAIVWLTLATVFAVVAHRLALFSARPPAGPERALLVMRLYMGLDTRADALLIGALVGMAASWNLLPRGKWFRALTSCSAAVAVVVIVLFLANSCLDHHAHYYGLFTVFAGLVAAFLVRMLDAPPSWATAILESRALVGVGRISYALYLFHMPIIHWFGPARAGAPPSSLALPVLGLTFAAAILSYFLIERPCLRLKSRFGHQPVPQGRASSGDVGADTEPVRRAA